MTWRLLVPGAALVLVTGVAIARMDRPGAGGAQGIAVVVRDAEGRPVAGAVVSVTPDPRRQKIAEGTSRDGTFRIALDPGSYEVFAGFGGTTRTPAVAVRVGPGEYATVELTFPRGTLFPPDKERDLADLEAT